MHINVGPKRNSLIRSPNPWPQNSLPLLNSNTTNDVVPSPSHVNLIIPPHKIFILSTTNHSNNNNNNINKVSVSSLFILIPNSHSHDPL